MSLSGWIPVLAAVIGGGAISAIAAWLTYRLNKKKSVLEIEKFNLEVAKLKSEVDYKLSPLQEHVLFDSRKGVDGFDVDIRGASLDHGQPVGAGKHKILDGKVINIERTNQVGRYEVVLMQIEYQSNKRTYVPANLAIAGKRKILVRYLAKAIGGEHQVKTVLKSTGTDGKGKDGKWLASKDDDIECQDQWQEIECFFLVDPTEDFFIRFDDRGVAVVPSSLQIKDIVVTEKAS
jgi:hypothetical protein